MQYGAGSAVITAGSQPGFSTDFYLSGTTFFTLGLGDVVPRTSLARALVVTEAGLGFGFLAAVIGYLPFIYGSFSKREVNISLLDARAGTPPTAGELLRRHAYPRGSEALRELLKGWEFWAAELMESHLSYPVLAFFRSQHDNQSWIAALTAILDALSQVFKSPPRALPHNRLPAEDLRHIRDVLEQHGVKLLDGPDADRKLTDLRNMYEPYLYALAEYLSLSLPPWIPSKKGKDNWQTTAWGRSAGLVEKEGAAIGAEEHF
jgi:Ion channel